MEGNAVSLLKHLHYPWIRARPSRPAIGGTDSRRTGSDEVKAHTSENPKALKKEPTPCRPESAFHHQNGRRRMSASQTASPTEEGKNRKDPLAESQTRHGNQNGQVNGRPPGSKRSRKTSEPEQRSPQAGIRRRHPCQNTERW